MTLSFHVHSPSSAPENWMQNHPQHTFPVSETFLSCSGIWESLCCHLQHGLKVTIISGYISIHRETTWRKLNRKRSCCPFSKNVIFSPKRNANQGHLIHWQEETSLSFPYLICSTKRQKIMSSPKWMVDASVLTCGLQPYFLCFVTSFSCSLPTVAYVGLCDTH